MLPRALTAPSVIVLATVEAERSTLKSVGVVVPLVMVPWI